MRHSRLGFAVLVCCVAVIGIAPPCLACSCPRSTEAEYHQRADVVFIGRAIERKDAYREKENPRGEPHVWWFQVESVQKGRVLLNQNVTTPSDQARCGFPFIASRRYQVFATRNGENLVTDGCAGNRELEDPYQLEILTSTAKPTPYLPTPMPTVTPTPTRSPSPTVSALPTPTAEVLDVAPTADEDSSALPAVFALAGAITLLVIAVGLIRRTSG